MPIPRKKRTRYKVRALEISKEKGFVLDSNDWEQVWSVLDKYGYYSSGPDYLYAIIDHARNLVKFGHSNNPGARLQSIRTGNGSKVVLAALCEEESPFTEKEVHKELREFRVRGEWFRLCGKTMEMVLKINNHG